MKIKNAKPLKHQKLQTIAEERQKENFHQIMKQTQRSQDKKNGPKEGCCPNNKQAATAQTNKFVGTF